MSASPLGSTVTPKCIPRVQPGAPVQVDLHRATCKGCFPSHPGTARDPVEWGQAQGAAGDLAGKPWSPFPAAAGMHVVQSPLVTDCIAACARIQLDSSPRGDVPRAWWQEEGEGQPPRCCRQLAGRTRCVGPWAAVARVEACPRASAGSQDPTWRRPRRAGLGEARAAGIWGKAPLKHVGIRPQSRAVLGAPRAGGSSRELPCPLPDALLPCDSPFSKQQCPLLCGAGEA